MLVFALLLWHNGDSKIDIYKYEKAYNRPFQSAF